jgi:molybdenum cofactor cytidylyltransferase
VKVTAVVLAAGSASRFGSVKLLAPLGDRPVLQHTLDAVAAAGQGDVVVVLGDASAEVEAAIAWRGERRLVNPSPEAGLSGSVRIGIEAAAEDPACEAALVVLGDQPAVRPGVLRSVVVAGEARPEPFVRARYAHDGAPNPVLVKREAFAEAAALTGDRGLGPLLAADPSRVHAVDAPGANPDVDTPADLAALAATHATETEAAR